MGKKKTNTEEIEAAIGRFNKKRLRLVEQEVDDRVIREMLRPKTILEHDRRAIVLLRYLKKYRELPGPIVKRILRTSTHGVSSDGILGHIRKDGFIMVRRSLFDGHMCNLYSLTKKGEEAVSKDKAR